MTATRAVRTDRPGRRRSERAASRRGVPAACSTARTDGRLDSPAGQYNFLQGGNPALLPEESDTDTYGVILQPRFLPKLAMSIDYFDIEIQDTVSTFGADNTSNACYTTTTPPLAPASTATRQRLAVARRRPRRGPEHQHRFARDQGLGPEPDLRRGRDGPVRRAQLQPDRHLLDELATNRARGFAPYDCAGMFADDSAAPNPEWRHHFRIGWESPWNVDVSLTWRYYDSVEKIRSHPANIDFELDDQNYFDLAANWHVTEKASVLLGINNILDEDPPISSERGHDW